MVGVLLKARRLEESVVSLERNDKIAKLSRCTQFAPEVDDLSANFINMWRHLPAEVKMLHRVV